MIDGILKMRKTNFKEIVYNFFSNIENKRNIIKLSTYVLENAYSNYYN